MAAVASGCGGSGSDTASGAPGAADTAAERAFLRSHWRRPVPPQGDPPAGWAPAVVDLAPEACGVCHPDQLREWSGSLHAGAYSPGLAAQLAAWRDSDPATVASCLGCHAPLSEQLGRPALVERGIVCAACHVRGWRRFGPPRRDGSVDPAPPGTPHGGATRTPAFEASAFCAPCHQFEAPAPNGKPLENTVREWESTEFAARGITCQSCHMPDRLHQWRGIHHPETTRRGVTPRWRVSGGSADAGFVVRLSLVNDGTGHHFPTYVTPAVDLKIAFLDARGDTLALRRKALQRAVRFAGEWIEERDDRIPSGGEAGIAWRGPAPAGASRVVGRIGVRPDAYYERFYGELLADRSAGYDRALLEEALRRARASGYELWRAETSLR